MVKIWRDTFGDTATVERMEEELGELACGLILHRVRRDCC